MAHPQNSPRGLFAKRRIDVADGSGNVSQITADSTALVLSAGVKISDARYITANSTAYLFTVESGLPGNVDGAGGLTAITNSTGHAYAINTTGTTWLWVSGTSVQPTT